MNTSDRSDFSTAWPKPSCSCSNIQPANPVRERAEFQCVDCNRLFPESLIEEVAGKYRMIEIVVKRRPRRR